MLQEPPGKPVLAREREARFKEESLPNMVSTAVWTSMREERQRESKRVKEREREERKRESKHLWRTSNRYLGNTWAKGCLGIEMFYRGSQHVKWSSAAPGGAALTTPERDDENKQAVKIDSLDASKRYSNQMHVQILPRNMNPQVPNTHQQEHNGTYPKNI